MTALVCPPLLKGSNPMTRKNTRGFALPLAIFAMVILTLVATAGLFTGRQESRIGFAHDHASRVFYLAEQGLVDVLANWEAYGSTSLPVQGDTTLDGTLSDGSWSVELTRLSSQLFLLESTGVLSRGGPVLSGATRRLAMIARLVSADLDVPAALTTRDATSVRGTAEVHGEDVDPPSWEGLCIGPHVDKPGILTDNAAAVTTTGVGEITGTPAVAEDSTLSDATFTQFGSLSWTDLVAMADKTLAGGSFSSVTPVVNEAGGCDRGAPFNWGDPDTPTGPCGNYFPTIHVTGDAYMQGGGSGQGLLLVDGDLDLRGGFTFYGVIVVQGAFMTQGSGNRIYGGVLASNADFADQSLTGSSVIQQSSCAVGRAVENSTALTQPHALAERSWVDLSALGGP